ncbi:MAG: hypothetical protein GY822_12370 [Deltaproteobacteria bacterium]|nr:hypothetical protein [Deltaproteobacteria bacterium]
MSKTTARFRVFSWVLPLLATFVGINLVLLDARAPALASPKAKHRLSSLRIFNRVVLLVKEQYVEPGRIEPKKMLLSALEAVEKKVPEVLVEAPQGDIIGITVGDERRTFFLNDVSSLWEFSFKLRDVFRFMEARFSPDVNTREVEYAAINGMLGELDPHSLLLEPRYSKEMKLSTKGEFGGLGIVISIRDGMLTVISPIDETPAARAGIKAQDRIVKIEEESTVNMGLDEAVERLRGAPNTDIIIWVERKGWNEPKKFVLTRAVIRVDSVTHELLEANIGYVKIKQFQGHTAEDVAAAVADMRKKTKGQLDGLILDLRNNPGGLLDQSVEVSNLFLESGVIVVTQEGGQRNERKEIKAVPRPNKLKVPLVVLVNGGSASASEIVSGAIKNRDRGLIIGTQTFGKGSVQQLYDFPDTSSLKLTIGQYMTPGDESIQSVGITPDVDVTALLINGKDSINLFPDQSTKEADLAAHLDNSLTKKRKPDFKMSFLAPVLTEAEMEKRANTNKFNDDFLIAFARRVLKSGAGADTRTKMLRVAANVVQQTEGEEHIKITESLKKLDVDWSLPTARQKGPGSLSAKVNALKPVNAGEEFEITVEVTNTGSQPLWQVRGISEGTLYFLGNREFLFGFIGAGQTRTWTTKIKTSKELGSRHDTMRIAFSDHQDKKLGSLDVSVDFAGLKRPRFSYSLFIDDTTCLGEKKHCGNGDGMLQPNEEVELVINVHNDGEGSAEKPQALLKNLTGPSVFIEKGRHTLKELKSGKSEVVRFRFIIKEDATDKAEMRLQVFDSVMGDYLVEKLSFPVRSAASGAAKPLKKGWVKVQNGASVRAAADRDSSVVATVKSGAVLLAEASVGEFFRVSLGDRLHGFVARAEVMEGAKRPKTAKGTPQGLSLVMGRNPPRIIFKGVDLHQPIITAKDDFSLTAVVNDDGPVSDVYVFVGQEKVFYERIRSKGPTSHRVQTQLKLKPGINLVTVVAREDDEFAQREVLTIFNSKGNAFEKKKVKRH